MNKQRLEKILKVKESLELILEEEQNYYDELSENAQEGDKGEQSQNSISELEDAISSLENIE